MRKIRELLELLLSQIEQCKEEYFCGMCGEIYVMSGKYDKFSFASTKSQDSTTKFHEITKFEGCKLREYLRENRPEEALPGYWWDEIITGEGSLDFIHPKEPRIKWLKQQLIKLDKDENN